MHTVENSNVSKKGNNELKSNDDNSSYTSILNLAIDSTKKKERDSINRFYYSAGDYNFLFEQDLKVENLPITQINKVPHAPAWCTGIISVRGVIMPVLDMHVILKDELNSSLKNKSKKNKKEQNTDIHLLMVEHKNHAPIVLQIDQLPERVNIKKFTYSKVEKNHPSWLEKVWKNSNNKLYEINHDEFFNRIKSVNI